MFAPPRADGPGNYNNHEQNGGRLFSVSKMVLESTLYPQAVGDWADQVRGAAGIAAALLQPVGLDEEPSLPFPQLVRTPMPQGSLAQAYCKVAYGPSGKVHAQLFSQLAWRVLVQLKNHAIVACVCAAGRGQIRQERL